MRSCCSTILTGRGCDECKRRWSPRRAAHHGDLPRLAAGPGWGPTATSTCWRRANSPGWSRRSRSLHGREVLRAGRRATSCAPSPASWPSSSNTGADAPNERRASRHCPRPEDHAAPVVRDRRRPPHALRPERHRLPGCHRGPARPPRRPGAALPDRARWPGGRRGHLRPGGAVGARAQRGARGEPAAAVPAHHPGLLAQPRLRLRRPGHHQRRRPDPPGPRRRDPRRRRGVALRHPDPALAGGSARSWSRRARRRRSGSGSGIFAQVRPRDLVPVTPAIAEPSTGESMGQSAEKMAKENGITREAQDRLALLSHQRAAAGDRRRPAHRGDRALVRRPGHGRGGHQRQRHPRRHLARGARQAQAGVRPRATARSPPATPRRSPTAPRWCC